MKIAFTCSLFTFMALIASCNSCNPDIRPLTVDLLVESELLSFIQDGEATRGEILQKLGPPHQEAKKQGIIFYRIYIDDEGTANLRPCAILFASCHSLVLVFGDDGILERHSLVGASHAHK